MQAGIAEPRRGSLRDTPPSSRRPQNVGDKRFCMHVAVGGARGKMKWRSVHRDRVPAYQWENACSAGETPQMKIATITLMVSLCVAPLAGMDLTQLAARADGSAQKHMADGKLPGLAIAVAVHGQIVLSRSYGTADLELDVPITDETMWEIRSITKQYTAAMIMRLVEAGTIALDDPVTKHLNYPTQGNTVTIRQLLTHTSGLTKESSRLNLKTALSGGEKQWFKLDLSYEEMVARFGQFPFEFAPGERYDYNNLGYYLLGQIIARYAGVPYAEAVERDLLQPLGLKETMYCDDHRIIRGRASGYEFYNGRLMNAAYTVPGPIDAGGGLCATTADLIRWTQLLWSGKVVSAASLQQMLTSTALAGGATSRYGFGTYLDDVSGQRKFFHGGTRPGFGTFLSHYPEAGLTIAVVTNHGRGRSRMEDLEKELAGAAMGIVVRDLPLAAGELALYQGRYTVASEDGQTEMRLYDEDGSLMLQLGDRTTRLRNQGDHVLIATLDDDLRFNFNVVEDRVFELTVQMGRVVRPAKRVQ